MDKVQDHHVLSGAACLPLRCYLCVDTAVCMTFQAAYAIKCMFICMIIAALP